MNAASVSFIHELRPKIIDRRARLEAAAHSLSPGYVNHLLAEIDDALEKIDNSSYGLCETCRDPIEPDRLERNPLERFCLDHLTAEQRRAHEADLQLATQIQSRLLPARDVTATRWEAHFRYEPAGVVGGDYCEILLLEDGESLFFAVGDVAGKGVAASLLMTHLSAIFRSLLSLNLPLPEIIVRANRLFCDSTPTTHYATLVAGRTSDDGVVLCNAGHCSPLLLTQNQTQHVEASGLPLGLFYESEYQVRHIPLQPGDSLVLYSDGITEAQDPQGNVYDEDRLIGSAQIHHKGSAAALAEGLIRDVAYFRDGRTQLDDLTVLVLRRRCC